MGLKICGWRPRFTYFGVYGSVMPISLPICLLSGFFCFSLMYWHVINHLVLDPETGKPIKDPVTGLETGELNPSGGAGLMYHPNVYIFFLSIVSLVCAFHVNAAYGRFWEGRGALQRIATAWTTAAATIVNMDALEQQSGGFAGSREFPKSPDNTPRTAEPEHVALKAYVLHVLSLMHASGVTWLLTSDNRYGKKYKVEHKGAWLEILGGVSKVESEELVQHYDREFWMLNELHKTMSVYKSPSGEAIPAGVAARFIAQISDGFGGLEACRKIEDTSFPFAYVQVLFWLQFMVVIVTPVIIACWMKRIPLAVVLTCMMVFTFLSIFLAAHRMENPFGYSSTKLPMMQLHTDFIDRLHALCDTPLAQELENMPGDDQDFASVIQVKPRPSLVTGGGVLMLSKVVISTNTVGSNTA